MLIKKLVESLVEEKAPGPSPSFSVIHLIKTLELVANEGPIGRGKISKKLNMGEGAVRTLLDRLKHAGLVVLSKSGCALSVKGKKLWKQFQTFFPVKVKIEQSELTLSSCNVAILIRGCGSKVKIGMEQRDAAVMSGAKGATTLVFKNKKLILPMISEDVAKDFPKAYCKLVEKVQLKEDDVIVIGSADAWEKAEYGALAAAWTLIENC